MKEFNLQAFIEDIDRASKEMMDLKKEMDLDRATFSKDSEQFNRAYTELEKAIEFSNRLRSISLS